MKVLDPQHSGKASGSIDGRTFYNYGNLNCVKKLAIPSQPNTARQIEVRSNLAILSFTWANILNEGQRTAWRNFAKEFIWNDLWGREFILKGIALFQKFNFQLQDTGRTLQLNPPPAVSPSEVSIKLIENAGGEVRVVINPVSAGEIASQSPFVDVWITVDSTVASIDPPPDLLINVNGFYKPQGVNPVKSDYRHRHYFTEAVQGEPPIPLDMTVQLHNPTGNPFEIPTRLALVIRRYNKYGRYSGVSRVSFISTLAEL